MEVGEIVSNFAYFFTRDSLRISNNETIAQLTSKPFPKLVLFKANKENRYGSLESPIISHRECLLELATPLKFLNYEDEADIQKIVNFVNKNCGTFRAINGEYTRQENSLQLLTICREHKIRMKILENLFDPRTETSNECERISNPTPEYFFKNYVLKSKPVIITDGKKLLHFFTPRKCFTNGQQ